MAGPQADSTSPANQAKPAVPRRFIGVRQRPSGRWVAEIKDSSQRMRLWLGTFDSPEEAARAYDEAARALRGDNARTNFATSSPMTSESSSPADGLSPEPEGKRGVNFTSLKAKLSKNLQSIIARSSENKAAKSRVSDHFTFASIFHRHRIHHHHHHQPLQLDTMTMEKLVQPSFIVPHVTENHSWDSTSGFDHSGNANLCESIARFAPLPSDSDGSDVGEMGPLMSRLQFDHEEMAGMGWIDGNKLERESESNRGSKRFKVSSSVIVPPSFSANEFHDLSQ